MTTTTPNSTKSYAAAINAALAEEMERDPSLFVMGPGSGRLGGVFGVTRHRYDPFGPDRVIDTAIVEHLIVGGALGAALTGTRLC